MDGVPKRMQSLCKCVQHVGTAKPYTHSVLALDTHTQTHTHKLTN